MQLCVITICHVFLADLDGSKLELDDSERALGPWRLVLL